MRRILLSLLTIAFVGVMATAATHSYFNSQAELSDITFSSGNANLDVYCSVNGEGVGAGKNCNFNFDSTLWYPGLSEDRVITLHNGSTAPITLATSAWIEENSLTQTQNLGSVVSLQFYIDDTPIGAPEPLDNLVGSANQINLGQIAQDSSKQVKIMLEMSPQATSANAGGNVSFDLIFDGVQTP